MRPRYNLEADRARLRAAKAQLQRIRATDPVEYRRFMSALRAGRPFLTNPLRRDIRALWKGFAPVQSPVSQ
jgi:hypothetical protein